MIDFLYLYLLCLSAAILCYTGFQTNHCSIRILLLLYLLLWFWDFIIKNLQDFIKIYRALIKDIFLIPPSYSFKLLQSWTFFRYFHPVPRKRVRLGILPHMPRNASTYTRRHTFSTVLTCMMSPKRKMVSPMRSAAIWRLSTFHCRNSKERSVEPISREIKYFCAACLDQQCRSIKCIRCKPAMAMTALTPFDANCRFDYTSGRTCRTGRKRSMETYLRIDLVEIIEYASIRKTIHRGYTLTKWIRAI